MNWTGRGWEGEWEKTQKVSFFLLLGMMYAALFGVMMKFYVPFFWVSMTSLGENANAKKFLPSKMGPFQFFPFLNSILYYFHGLGIWLFGGEVILSLWAMEHGNHGSNFVVQIFEIFAYGSCITFLQVWRLVVVCGGGKRNPIIKLLPYYWGIRGCSSAPLCSASVRRFTVVDLTN